MKRDEELTFIEILSMLQYTGTGSKTSHYFRATLAIIIGIIGGLG